MHLIHLLIRLYTLNTNYTFLLTENAFKKLEKESRCHEVSVL